MIQWPFLNNLLGFMFKIDLRCTLLYVVGENIQANEWKGPYIGLKKRSEFDLCQKKELILNY